MPHLATTSSASTSVFARFKRHNTGGIGTTSSGDAAAAATALASSPEKNRADLKLHRPRTASVSGPGGAVEWKGGKLVQHDQITKTQNSHRRDSSILSLTTTVADSAKEFGANVRRSVSLRSQSQSQRGSGSGSSFGNGNNTSISNPHSARVSGSGQHSTPLSAASAVEASEEEGKEKDKVDSTAAPTAAATTTTATATATATGTPTATASGPASAQPPPLRRKISLTAKGLTSKFKSTEALPSLQSPVYLQSVGAFSPPAFERGDPMLVSAPPSHPPPALGRKTSDQLRPGLQTQTSATRDISSSHGTGASLQQAASVPQSVSGGPLNPKTIYTTIQETSAKRMATIDYMRKLHEGDIFYFGTMHYSPAVLQSLPSMQTHKLGRRATNYFLLGYSLPLVLDVNSNTPMEFLRALSGLLAEFETYQTLCGFDASGNTVKNSRMGGMFKSSIRSTKGRRSSTAIAPSDLALDARQAELLGLTSHRDPQDLTSSINPTGHEFSFLMTPNIPFEPDFSTTLGTLCDSLIDTYAKLTELVSGPEHCTPLVGEAFSKADKAIRKILVANVMREFEETTRGGMKSEMAGLGKLTLGGLM